MKAILSTTYDDQYLFFLPITVWSWNKLGIDCIIYTPLSCFEKRPKRTMLATSCANREEVRNMSVTFECPPEKEATYAQCSRLYMAALRGDFSDDEVLITADIDMAVFNQEYFKWADNKQINIFGTDLVPDKQFPMCYIAMPAKTWGEVMWIREGETVQDKLDQLLGHIECEHFRGNMWGKDQETAYNHIVASGLPVIKYNRAAPGTQFATRRADRDGWPQAFSPDLIDAHLPRPGHTEENFAKILNLFQSMYPNDDFQWMVDYRNEYIKLL